MVVTLDNITRKVKHGKSPVIVCRFTPEVITKLKRLAEIRKVSTAKLVRLAVKEWLVNNDLNRSC